VSSIVDIKSLHEAYTHLSEKFKTFWTFHQFLQGVQKTFFGGATGLHQVDFQSIYEEMKTITAAMQVQQPAVVLDTINRLDSRLELIHRKLLDEDQKISPNYVRRFFEKVRTEDEKLLLALLRFYFYAKVLDHDELDKIDFLMTIVGARRSIDDGHYMPRFPIELQKLFNGFLALAKRPAPDPAEVKVLVGLIERLKGDIEGCQKFEELTEKKTLENLRTLKHKLGAAFFSADVLSALLEANLAAKNRFLALYDGEEQRILQASRRLMEMESALEKQKEGGEDLWEEFQKFKRYKEEFEKHERGVRHQDVTRLAESIESLMARLEAATTAEAAEGSEPPGPTEETLPGINAPSQPGEMVGLPGTSDPLTGESAGKILGSIDMMEEGTGSGQAAYAKTLARLRLEPWEVRAARRILREESPPSALAQGLDALFFEGASLRIRIDEEAQHLKAPGHPTEAQLDDAGMCLVRAQEMDRRFRTAVEAMKTAPSESLNEVNRSRFRLLRSFAGLWLLHNAHVVG